MVSTEDIKTLKEAQTVIKNFIRQHVEKDSFITLSLYTQAYDLLNSIIVNNRITCIPTLPLATTGTDKSLKDLLEKALNNSSSNKPKYKPPIYPPDTLIGVNATQPLSEKSNHEQKLLQDTNIKDSTKEEYFEIIEQELDDGVNILFRFLNGDVDSSIETQVEFLNSVVKSIENKLPYADNVLCLKEEKTYNALTYFYNLVQLKLLRL